MRLLNPKRLLNSCWEPLRCRRFEALLMPVVGDPRSWLDLPEKILSLAGHCLFGIGNSVEDDDFRVHGFFRNQKQIQREKREATVLETDAPFARPIIQVAAFVHFAR